MAILCQKCKEINKNRERSEIRYCLECAKKNKRMYIQRIKKPQVEYLYEIMVERNIGEINNSNKDLLIEALDRAGSVTHRVSGAYLGTIMTSARGLELFEDIGFCYYPSLGRSLKVYRIRK